MSSLTNSKLRRMIMQELAKMVGEDALVSRSADSHITGVEDDDYPLGEKDVCEQCGSTNKYEKECMECGYMNRGAGMLQEGDCGCGGSSSSSDGSDYSIDTMESPVYGMGATSMHVDFPNHGGIQHHGHNNYMAKPSLYKVAKYAQKLLHMIPDGYELDDWQRHKIAQISDDISEVYHSLDYDFHDDEY